MSLPLFGEDEPDESPPLAARLAPRLRALAEEGVYIGTSSWKYDGWLGLVYSQTRYETRGKFSQRKFQDECLKEYAQTFPTVCGDFAFYQFPTKDYWAGLFGATPEKFIVSLKVPEDITVAVWPGHARYGQRAGRTNAHFLDAKTFGSLFVDRLRPYAGRVGPLIFEFGTFAKATFTTPAAFLERLNDFLTELPAGPRYAVEIRNPEYLGQPYFDVLSRHNVAHVFSSWTRMPALGDQIALAGSFTADFAVVRGLLQKGRTYEQAVKEFQPYKAIAQPSDAVRKALREIVRRAKLNARPTFLYLNNRLEGCAPLTIDAITEPAST